MDGIGQSMTNALGGFGTFLWVLIKILLILLPLLGCVAYLTLAERKVIGAMQIRMGPNRVGPAGLLQPIADALKLLFKEVIVPSSASKGLYILGPSLRLLLPLRHGR